ncbi:MAG: SUMF1/EgtB/PvdO family nonheme iron enzyme [Immundisolibacterales bacterium]|nr:SUMF1/EgtB/PvdO family nonheme iron enzyme [Immundisolibacterales bacterium]
MEARHRYPATPPTVTLAVLAALVALVAAAAVRAEYANPDGVAVIIGNRSYAGDLPAVDFAHRDAEAFRRYVLDVLGFDPENVIDLRDTTQADMWSTFGSRETAERSELWSYLADEGSDVVVFYSGHGVPGIDDQRGYLLPVDANPNTAELNGYPIDVLFENLANLESARSVAVYLDACFSGGSGGGMLIEGASPAFVEASLPGGDAERLTVLTAASGKQLASWDRKAKHGLFTLHLLEALYGKGDQDADGRVTAREAKAYLDRHMTRAAKRTWKRRQKASLMGNVEAVLANAGAGGAFPSRPVLDDAGVVAGPREQDAGRAGSARGAEDASRPADAPEAVEAALGLNHAQRVLVQRGLASLGFEVGVADGVFGRRTRVGLAAYQREKGLAETGYLEAELRDALVALGKAPATENRGLPARTEAMQRFRDCADCPEMVAVPAGSFEMGSAPGEKGRGGEEGPAHRVRISNPFAVGVYEVTFSEWESCRRAGGCSHNPDDRGWGRGNRPVVGVSWRDAQEYVRWLSGKTGKEYRLPSEAEWEYAARAGTVTRYWWGDALGRGRANCEDCGSRWDDRETAPVGSFSANGFGLHDVHGNAREWVEDCWHGGYRGAPTDGKEWTSGGDCGKRVLRGGSCFNPPRHLRSAMRVWKPIDRRDPDSSFRVAMTLD